MSVRHFVDGCERARPTVGRTTTRQVVLSYIKKQTVGSKPVRCVPPQTAQLQSSGFYLEFLP